MFSKQDDIQDEIKINDTCCLKTGVQNILKNKTP